MNFTIKYALQSCDDPNDMILFDSEEECKRFMAWAEHVNSFPEWIIEDLQDNGIQAKGMWDLKALYKNRELLKLFGEHLAMWDANTRGSDNLGDASAQDARDGDD